MKRHQWKLTGEPLLFDRDGDLLNGQHRLMACVQADTPFVSAIGEGIEAEVMTVVDTGLARRDADMLRFANIGRPTHIASVVRTVIAWRLGIVDNSNFVQREILRDDILEFAQKHEAVLIESVNIGDKLTKHLGGNRSAWAALAFELEEIDVELAEEFLDGVREGANLNAEDPRLALRNWVTNRQIQQRRVDPVVHLCTYTRAWNHWIAGSQMTHLKAWRRGTTLLRPDLP